MAKYSLYITDINCNTFVVPLQRNGEKPKEKVDLYEIDLLTISLGKEQFVNSLKQSKIAPSNFDWKTAIGYIQYKARGKNNYLPILFEKDHLLMQVLNFQNQCRYHKNMSETEIRGKMLSPNATYDFKEMLAKLSTYSDFVITRACQNQFDYLESSLPNQIKNKLYRYKHSTNSEERIEYRNDILRELISYSKFRKVKTVEYGIKIEEILWPFPLENSINEEKEEFLTDEEKMMMYGFEEIEKVYGKTYY